MNSFSGEIYSLTSVCFMLLNKLFHTNTTNLQMQLIHIRILIKVSVRNVGVRCIVEASVCANTQWLSCQLPP